MKILLADDDALIRRLLFALLSKLGHDVEAVEDGNSAVKILEGATPPALAIIDWVMPGLNGIEVCKRIRAHHARARPYLLLLSSKADKQDIIAGLDAGADDYLVKPFDPMALLARLRVAQRIIAYQQELQQHISGMETLLQRHNLLGEMFGRQGRSEPGASTGRPKPVANLAAVPQIAPAQIDQMLTRGLSEIGLADTKVVALSNPPAKFESTFTAWAPMILVREGLWIDLLLEADEASAVTTFETLLGRIPVSERELIDFLAETFNLLCTAMKNALTERGGTVLAPIISRSTRSGSVTVKRPALSDESRHRITYSDAALEISVVRQSAPVVEKSLGQLHEMDILAENLPSPSTTEVFLLNQGVVLNMRYIEKLTSLAKTENKELRVPVFEPSPYTEFFCLGRISGK